MSQSNLTQILFGGPEHRPFAIHPTQESFAGSALLLHGFPGTPADLRPLGQWLADRDWLAYGPLLPGLGQQITSLGAVGRRDWVRAANTAAMTLSRRTRPLLLVGFSMGAAVALHVAAAVRADLLILFAPFWQIEDWRAYPVSLLKYIIPQVTPLARADFQNSQLRDFLGEFLPALDLDDEQVQRVLRNEFIVPTGILSELLYLGREGFRFAPKVRVPTLVIQGKEDEVVTPAVTRTLVQQLGGPVSYYEVPGDHQFPKKLGTSGKRLDVEQIISKFIERNTRK